MLLRHKDSGGYEVCLSSAAEEQLYRVRVTPISCDDQPLHAKRMLGGRSWRAGGGERSCRENS